MQFLKILFWCLLAFVAALFTYGNWNTVPVHLWGGLIADVNLPLLLLAMFLIGLVPTLAYQHWYRWRLAQRLASTEQELAQARAVLTPPLTSPREPIAADVPPEPA